MIDTLRVSRRLRDAGASESVADAVAEAMAEVAANGRDELATKSDLADLRAAGQRDLQSGVQVLQSEVEKLRADAVHRFELMDGKTRARNHRVAEPDAAHDRRDGAFFRHISPSSESALTKKRIQSDDGVNPL